MENSSMRHLISQMLRFGVVGGSAFLIDYGLLYLLTEFVGINYLISSCISFSVSVVYNYIFSIFWVFDVQKNGNKAGEFLIFFVLSVIGLGINTFIMWAMVDMLSIHYLISKLFATAIVMVYNFITRKLFLENKNNK